MNIRPIPTIKQCTEIGTIVRPHGKEGEVLIATKCDLERFQSLSYVFICLQERLVPFFISSVSSKGNSIFIQFEDIQSMEKAETFCGLKIYSEGKNDDTDTSTDVDIIGYTITNAETNEVIGSIHDIIAYSMNVVLDVTRPDGTSVLIPFAEDLIMGSNEKEKNITMTIPDGLLEM